MILETESPLWKRNIDEGTVQIATNRMRRGAVPEPAAKLLKARQSKWLVDGVPFVSMAAYLGISQELINKAQNFRQYRQQ